MYMQLKEIEPCNISKTSDADGQKFFRRLTGKESFDWDGSVKPKCMLLDCIIYKENRGLNTVTGHLMSITVDKFEQINDIGVSVEGIIDEYKIGWIQIDYKTEDNPPNVSIKAYTNTYSPNAGNKASNSYEELGNMNTMGAPASLQTSNYSNSNSSNNLSKYNKSSPISTSGSSKKLIALSAVLIALVLGLYKLINPKPAALNQATYYAMKESNLRSSPTKGKNIISTIPKGSSVTVIENNGEWLKVRFNSSEGYIKSNLLSTSQQ